MNIKVTVYEEIKSNSILYKYNLVPKWASITVEKNKSYLMYEQPNAVRGLL